MHRIINQFRALTLGEAGDGVRRQTVLFVVLYHYITLLRLLPLCLQVCTEIWTLAGAPGECVLLERLVKHATSLYLVEPDRQGTYVCVLGLVINTWTTRLLPLPAIDGTSLCGSKETR